MSEQLGRKVSYEELDDIIQHYQAEHDTSFASQLVDAFKGFLIRYLDIIHYGRYNIDDRMTREFISLYMSDGDRRRHIHQFRHMPLVRHEVYKTAESVRSVFASYQESEVWNELICALLHLASRYRSPDGKPRFHLYIRRAFRYQVWRQFKALLADSLAEQYDDNLYGCLPEITVETATLEAHQRKQMMIENAWDDKLNENWVNGFTCAEAFTTLTKMERRILKLYYQDNLTDQQIADLTGAVRVTVNRRRTVAKEKVADALRKGNAV